MTETERRRMPHGTDLTGHAAAERRKSTGRRGLRDLLHRRIPDVATALPAA